MLVYECSNHKHLCIIKLPKFSCAYVLLCSTESPSKHENLRHFPDWPYEANLLPLFEESIITNKPTRDLFFAPSRFAYPLQQSALTSCKCMVVSSGSSRSWLSLCWEDSWIGWKKTQYYNLKKIALILSASSGHILLEPTQMLKTPCPSFARYPLRR